MNSNQNPYHYHFITVNPDGTPTRTCADPIITVSKLTPVQEEYRRIYENVEAALVDAYGLKEFDDVIKAFVATKNPVEFVIDDGDYEVRYDTVSKM